MEANEFLTGEEVSLEEMLRERERRAARQAALAAPGAVLVMVSMNMAGPIKSFPLLLQGFAAATKRWEGRLQRIGIPFSLLESSREKTGAVAFYRVEAPGKTVKSMACALEELPHLGRLLDVDVLEAGRKWERGELGLPERRCLLCNAPAALCGRSRRHSVEQLQQETVGRLLAYFGDEAQRQTAAAAGRAMLYEASVTPKPGLVDRRGSGAHGDMDFFTFLDSAAVLSPWMGRMCRWGFESRAWDEEAFAHLQGLGQDAEREMFQITRGVNTHRGMVFSLGLLAAAAGHLRFAQLQGGPAPGAEELCAAAADLARHALKDLGRDTASHGGAVFAAYESGGVRQEAAAGFPAVRRDVLPHLRRGQGTLEQRGKRALVELMAHVEDTNVLYRGGKAALAALSSKAQAIRLLPEEALDPALEEWDAELCVSGISPGGCADLLAVGYFLYFMEGGK